MREVKVNAPTRNRTFYANDVTSPGDIGSNDALTLQDIDRIVSSLRESSVPLAPIKIKGDDATWNVPMWAMFVTERQWLCLKSRTGQTQWNEAIKYAFERKTAAGGSKHPLFDTYETIMWNGMLIKRLSRYAIHFNLGDSTYTYTETTVAASTSIDCAITRLFFYDWSEKEVDHGNN